MRVKSLTIRHALSVMTHVILSTNTGAEHFHFATFPVFRDAISQVALRRTARVNFISATINHTKTGFFFPVAEDVFCVFSAFVNKKAINTFLYLVGKLSTQVDLARLS